MKRYRHTRTKHTGRIIWWDAVRGFGKIRSSEGGVVFVHYSDVITSNKYRGHVTFAKGDLVEYAVEGNAEEGWQAVEVYAR